MSDRSRNGMGGYYRPVDGFTLPSVVVRSASATLSCMIPFRVYRVRHGFPAIASGALLNASQLAADDVLVVVKANW